MCVHTASSRSLRPVRRYTASEREEDTYMAYSLRPLLIGHRQTKADVLETQETALSRAVVSFSNTQQQLDN